MGTREHILDAASELLARRGIEGTSTRAVCEAATVTAPTLYHHFGDKQGLLDAVVSTGFERYLAEKRASLSGTDPVADLRGGWDAHVAFGIRHPAFYTVMFGPTSNAHVPAAAWTALQFLLDLLTAVQRAGRLRPDINLAAQMVATSAHGVTSLLIAWPNAPWRDELSATLRESLIASVVRPEAGTSPR